MPLCYYAAAVTLRFHADAVFARLPAQLVIADVTISRLRR